MTEFRLYKSPVRALKIILLCSLLIAGGLYLLLFTNSPKWIGWTNIVFFGLGYPIGFFHLLDKRVQIIISELGIWDRTINQELITWELIKEAYPININGQKFISLVVAKEIDKKFKQYKWATKLSKEVGAQKLNLQLSQIKIDVVKFTDFVNLMIKANNEEKKKLINTLPNKSYM